MGITVAREYSEIINLDEVVVKPTHTESETHYVKQSADPLRHCSICQFFGGNGVCEKVLPEPDPILEDGVCDLFSQVQVEEMEVKELSDATKGFIALKMDWQYQIERLQDALYRIFGENDAWTWQDPWTYHITMLYAANISNEQLMEAAKVVVGQAAFDIHFIGIKAFDTPEGKAVYLEVEPNEALSAFQKAIYAAVAAQGVELSPFSVAAQWVPHLTLAYAPADAVIPEVEIDINTYADMVQFSRDNYTCVAEFPLTYTYTPPPGEDGMGPAPALEQARWKANDGSGLKIATEIGDWDALKAAEAIFEKAGFGGKTRPDTAFAQQAFLIHNEGAPTLKTSYRFPIAALVGEEVQLVPAALKSASTNFAKFTMYENIRTDAVKFLSEYQAKAGVSEMHTETIRMTMIGEMRGSYPDIPIENIDLDELEAISGEKPFFVTLPIGKAGARSNNGRNYLRSAVEDMVEQINLNHPYGAWGHLTVEEMSTRFDPPAIQWFGALLDADGIAWGKLMPLNKETRDYYRTAKATNSRVATSLTALAEMKGEDVLGMDLKSVDIAEPARVGIPAAVGAPQLTSEMGDVFYKVRQESPVAPVPVSVSEQEKSETMLTETEVVALQESVTTFKTQVGELTSKNTLLETQVRELSEREKTNLTEIGVLLGEFIVNTVKETVKIVANQGIIAEMVRMEQPQNRDQVKAKLAEILERPYVKAFNQSGLANEMGPNQPVPQRSNVQESSDAPKGGLNPRPQRVTIPVQED